MAKDPAFLFYPGDWLGGTMLMTRHQKGCYIDLLMAQFNNGPLSLDHIKAVLGQDQAIWTVLQEKFKVDNCGKFFNEKMATEIEKRKAYVASRSHDNSGRKKSYDKSYEKHTDNHTEDVNEDVNEIKNKKTSEKKFNFKQSMLDYGFSENLIDDWIQVRKTKKATNTQTVFDKFIAELEKRKCEKNQILTVIVEKSWSGFNWKWLEQEKEIKNETNKTATFHGPTAAKDLF